MIRAAPTEILWSAPGRSRGDDAFGLIYTRNALHVWVIDGATSVSVKPDKIVPGLSDAGWFSRALSSALREKLRYHDLTDGALRSIIAKLRARFVALAGSDLDLHDFPVAAMTYLQITQLGHLFTVQSLSFADCFHAVVPLPERRPLSAAMPLILKKTSLPESGPVIDRLRLRRAAQVGDLASTALTIDSASVATGLRDVLTAPSGAEIMLGSDGYARLWTEYALDSMPKVLADTVRTGAAAQLSRLRAWEDNFGDHDLAPKPADDVTLIRIRLGRLPIAGKLRTHAQTLVWQADPNGQLSAEAMSAPRRVAHR